MELWFRRPGADQWPSASIRNGGRIGLTRCSAADSPNTMHHCLKNASPAIPPHSKDYRSVWDSAMAYAQAIARLAKQENCDKNAM